MGDTFTESQSGGFHPNASAHAWVSTHSPSSTIKPLASATGSNSNDRLIVDFQALSRRKRVPQVCLYGMTVRDPFVQRLREDPKTSSTFAFSLIQRYVRAPLEFSFSDQFFAGN